MKQIILLTLCMMLLCGCQGGTNSIESTPIPDMPAVSQTIERAEVLPTEDYTGFWRHTEYPESYCVTVTRQKDDCISLEITAIRDDGFQIATAGAADVQLIDGKGSFVFEDSFGNTGICRISFSDHVLHLQYATDEYQWWCIDAGEGTYTKEDRILLINSPEEGDLIRSSSFYAAVPQNRYGGDCDDYAYAPAEFLLWLTPVEQTEEGVFIRKSSIAVPYIVSDSGNRENLSILSGGNDGETPYGDRVFYFTTDELGEIVDVIAVDEGKADG